MNDNINKLPIQKINLKSDIDAPWFTIGLETKIKAKYIRQASGINCFAKLDLEIKPYLNKKIAVFNNKIAEINSGNAILCPLQNSDRDTIENLDIIVRGVIKGIKKACLDLSQKSYLVGGIEVIATSALFHLVDSRSRCYEMAVYLALLEIFEEEVKSA